MLVSNNEFIYIHKTLGEMINVFLTSEDYDIAVEQVIKNTLHFLGKIELSQQSSSLSNSLKAYHDDVIGNYLARPDKDAITGFFKDWLSYNLILRLTWVRNKDIFVRSVLFLHEHGFDLNFKLVKGSLAYGVMEEPDCGNALAHFLVINEISPLLSSLISLSTEKKINIDWNARDYANNTVFQLMLLVFNPRHQEFAKLLLNNGLIEINKRGKEGNTAAHLCVYLGLIDIFKILINDIKINLDLPNEVGLTPINLISKLNDIQTINKIIRMLDEVVIDADRDIYAKSNRIEDLSIEVAKTKYLDLKLDQFTGRSNEASIRDLFCDFIPLINNKSELLAIIQAQRKYLQNPEEEEAVIYSFSDEDCEEPINDNQLLNKLEVRANLLSGVTVLQTIIENHKQFQHLATEFRQKSKKRSASTETSSSPSFWALDTKPAKNIKEDKLENISNQPNSRN